jgi:hypothetical protein
MTPNLTDVGYKKLCNGECARISFNRASLTVRHLPISSTERHFVMEGPSGTHTLLCAATDLERLNAHWSVFATHSANQYHIARLQTKKEKP